MNLLRTRGASATGAACLALVALAGCSSSSGSNGASTSPSASASISSSPSSSGGTSTVVFDEKIQRELQQVGCYSGQVDGIVGPQTDAAILAFQEAVGLPADGELGPDTDAALKAAAAEGRKVCTGTPSPTSSPTQTPAKASCTAGAISAALPSGTKLLSYVCVDVAGAERWAAGQDKTGPAVTNFFMKSVDGAWQVVPNDEVCGTASAGLPKKILDYCGLT